jgi:hypothetical protein
MYGGLFGDLPATKDVKEESSSPTTAAPAPAATATGGLFGDPPPQSGSKEEDKFTRKITKSVTTFVPPAKKKKKSNPFLQAVGAAGTSMAFVPTALKRKRPNRFSKLEKPATVPPTVAVVPDTTVASTTRSTSIIQPSPQVNEAAALPPKLTDPLSFQEGLGSMTQTTFTSASEQPASIEIHEQQSSHSLSYKYTSQFLVDDPPEMTEIKDPYDPYVPNDLAQYWDRQALAKERHELEREAREAFERQQALRLQLEKEREESQKRGDYQATIQKQQEQRQQHILAMGRGRGRGRGRGVSNLPAWLVEKQRKEQEEQLGSASGVP